MWTDFSFYISYKQLSSCWSLELKWTFHYAQCPSINQGNLRDGPAGHQNEPHKFYLLTKTLHNTALNTCRFIIDITTVSEWLNYKTLYKYGHSHKMNALTVQNPRHKCDWETRKTTDKKIIANYIYLTVIMIILRL